MLTTQIKTDLVAAMKARDELRVSVLRMLISEFGYKQIELQRELSDDDARAVLAKEAKKRREAVESYTAGGRAAQAETERQELAIIEAYLPNMLSQTEIEKEIEKMDLPKEFGAAMKMVSPVFKGRADGAVVARVVKEVITN